VKFDDKISTIFKYTTIWTIEAWFPCFHAIQKIRRCWLLDIQTWMFFCEYFNFVLIFHHVKFDDKISTFFKYTTIWTIEAWFRCFHAIQKIRRCWLLDIQTWNFFCEYLKFVFLFHHLKLEDKISTILKSTTIWTIERDFAFFMQYKKLRGVDFWIFKSCMFFWEYLNFVFIFHHVKFEDKIPTIFKYTTIWTIGAWFRCFHTIQKIQRCWLLDIHILDVFCDFLNVVFLFHHVKFEDKISTIFKYTTIWTIEAWFRFFHAIQKL
jgi:hypothetical protein